jgi:hypothetical protein
MLLIVVTLLSSAGCQRPPDAAPSFRESLRCGMTREQVTQLAREKGYKGSDPSWLARSAASPSGNRKDLSLVDLTFHEARLVALREEHYDPRSRKIVYRTIDLCGTRDQANTR